MDLRNIWNGLARSGEAKYKLLPTSNAAPRVGRKIRTYVPVYAIALALSAAVITIVCGLGMYWHHYHRLLHDPDAYRASLSKEQYVRAVLDHPVEGLLDPEPIRQKCQDTQFQEGLVWQCALAVGGFGNLVNIWQHCVRYALEAGATTLVLPRIGVRSDNLIDLYSNDSSLSLSSLFDTDYFVSSWQDVCPQMRVAVSDADLPPAVVSPSARTLSLDPKSVKTFAIDDLLIMDPTTWRAGFDDWLATQLVAAGDKPPRLSAAAPVRVVQERALFQWNHDVDPPALTAAFPRLFRCREDARRLAAAALWNLEQMTGRATVADAILLPGLSGTTTGKASGTANSTASGTGSGSGRLAEDGFLGAHLRVAADAAAEDWPGYEAQAPLYLAEAQKHNLTHIYLATGSAEHRARFKRDAARAGLVVLTKRDLLDDAKERAALDALAWDQQALVDFEVLVHSAKFQGFAISSFSMQLAVRRAILPEAGKAVVRGKYDDDYYQDNLSHLICPGSQISPKAVWP